MTRLTRLKETSINYKEKKMRDLKVSGRNVRERTAQREAQRYVDKIERKVRKRKGGDKLIKFIERQIQKSDKAPMNFNEAYLRARETADGIKGAVKEKAKKSKLGAGIWFLVLLIVVPILVVVFLIVTRRMELPQEGQFNDEDFKP